MKKNDAIDVLLTRRAIRNFKSEQITDEELETVIEAGKYAPTAMGLQSPLIVALQNEEDVKEMNRLSTKVMELRGFNPRPGMLPYYGAPTIVVVFATKRAKNELYGILDASAVTTNMLNAAHAIGLGSIWIDRSREIFEMEEGKKLLSKWGITEEVVGVASIGLGYVNGEYPTPKERRENYSILIK